MVAINLSAIPCASLAARRSTARANFKMLLGLVPDIMQRNEKIK
jgi:hypothetical protein